MIFRIGLVALALAASATTARAQSILDQCGAETCKARLTAAELLREAEALVQAGRYDEARPLVAALRVIPAYRLQTRFLDGYIAEQTHRFGEAEALFKAILTDDPKQTRVRLELARTLLQEGHKAAADKQFRLAQQDGDLPPEIARTIRSVRDIIRAGRRWTLSVDLGIAPDTNINQATSASVIDIYLGGAPLPVNLDDQARKKSGFGETGTIEAGLRLPATKHVAMLLDATGTGTNYAGTAYDDFTAELAAGPAYTISRATELRVEGVAAQRWYGGRVLQRQAGAKIGFETLLNDRNRIGIQLDARHNDVRFDHNYDGWSYSGTLTFERALAKTVIASASGFARRDSLAVGAYSNTELGGQIGLGAELPHGFNVAAAGGVSRARYDDTMWVFSNDPRRDWRYTARFTLGNRGVRVLGFSPAVTLSWQRLQSNIAYYSTDRLRVRIGVARYF